MSGVNHQPLLVLAYSLWADVNYWIERVVWMLILLPRLSKDGIYTRTEPNPIHIALHHYTDTHTYQYSTNTRSRLLWGGFYRKSIAEKGNFGDEPFFVFFLIQQTQMWGETEKITKLEDFDTLIQTRTFKADQFKDFKFKYGKRLVKQV